MATPEGSPGRPFAGTTVLVTGAASGIGAATAERFADQGAQVACADVDVERASAVAERIGGAAYRHDVADAESWERVVAAVTTDLGPPHVLVNNAGITRDRSIVKMTDGEWDDVVGVNLRGTWLGCRAVLPGMVAARAGAIVNVSSESRFGSFGQANYASAKAGVVALTRTVALEHARHGIRCNAVAPGMVDTPMTRSLPDDIREQLRQRIPLGRYALAGEIAACVSFLAGPEASYITGQVVAVDGGTTW